MPPPESLDLSTLTSMAQQMQGSQALDPELQRALGSHTTGSIDLTALTSGLADASKSGPSFLDPTYLAISGVFQMVGVGLLVYAKKEGDLRFMCWAFAAFALGWDYTSLLWWGIAIALVVVGKLLE